MDGPWRLIPAHEAPSVVPTARTRARGWLRDLLARLEGDRSAPLDEAPPEDRLETVDATRLARLVPEPPRSAQRAAVDTLRGRRRQALVLRPDDGSWDAVLDDAGPGSPEILRPPEGVERGGTLPEATRARLRDPDPLHLARLERWGARHVGGVGPWRELLVALASRTDPWTADVVPWAWGWMRHALPEARGVPAAWMPAPLDGEALEVWLGRCDDRLRLRRRGGPPDLATFQSLAQRARGEAGVAAAIWHACLRDGAERAVAEHDAADDDETGESDVAPGAAEAGTADAGTVWVRHPGELELPSTASLERSDLVLLHAILLHGGAGPDAAARVAGMSSAPAAAACLRLVAIGLLERADDGRLRVAPLAQPAVRGRLEAEAFVRGSA